MDFYIEIKKTNVEIRNNILQVACMQTFRQKNNFYIFGQNLLKKEFKVYCWNKNQYPRDIMCTNFQLKL